MTIRKPILACGLTICLATGLAGCGSSEPQQTAVPAARTVAPSAPAPPPRPSVTPVDTLIAEMGIDERVYMTEDDAPATTAERKAVLEFFDAFARADAELLGTMMSGDDETELTALVDSGVWSQATAGIERIEVQTGLSPQGDTCSLAVFFTTSDFQPQLWSYQVEGIDSMFTSVSCPPGIIDDLYGDNWISQWYSLLDREMALAEKPDEEVRIARREIGDTSDRGSYDGPTGRPSGPSTPSDPTRPSAPSGPGRRQKGPKRAPPGKG